MIYIFYKIYFIYIYIYILNYSKMLDMAEKFSITLHVLFFLLDQIFFFCEKIHVLFFSKILFSIKRKYI
jgi:hypothetical protein